MYFNDRNNSFVDFVVTWQPMETAPRDGTPIQAKIPGNGKDNIIAWMSGFSDSEGQDRYSWVFLEDRKPPECWTDGVCWESNEDGKKSVEPIAWKPLNRVWIKNLTFAKQSICSTPLPEPIVITEKSIMTYRQKLLDCVNKENPGGSEFGYKTYLLDMLYFMGLAIDEKRFYAADGFEEFKKIIQQEL